MLILCTYFLVDLGKVGELDVSYVYILFYGMYDVRE